MEDNATIVSVRDELGAIRDEVHNVLSTLKRLDRLQETVDGIGGNPYRIRCSVSKRALDPSLTDSGFAKVLRDATRRNDPNSRELGYMAACESLKRGVDDLAAKKLKIEERAKLGAGSEGESANAASLSERMKEAMGGLGRKMKISLKGVMESRKKALEAVAEIDERILKMWPDGSPELREAALANHTADVMTALCANDELFRRGRKIEGVKRVRI